MAKKKSGAMAVRVKKTCPQCGREFSTNRGNKIYCRTPCQFKAWNLAHPRIGVKPPTT